MRRNPLATSGLVIGAVGALLLAGCSAAPTAEKSTSDASSFIPCAVSDVTGFDDKDFNQLSFEGVAEAAKELGTTTKRAESASEDQYAGNIGSLVDQNCNLIVTVGFSLAAATRDEAEQNTDINFALVDSALSDADNNPIELDNVKPILFDTAQAAALAGYLAAGVSKTGIVGTYGGMPFPSVTVFMDGFADGVDLYNKAHSTSVKLLGWDKASQNGLFVGSFDDQNKARSITEGLLDQGIDVVMPVAGTLFQASASAASDRATDLAVIGVNGDIYETTPQFREYYLTSVLKNLTTATKEVTLAAASGDFSSTPYVGTLENDGVGIAPTHDWESRIEPSLLAEVEQLKADIISGAVSVQSPSSPKL